MRYGIVGYFSPGSECPAENRAVDWERSWAFDNRAQNHTKICIFEGTNAHWGDVAEGTPIYRQ